MDHEALLRRGGCQRDRHRLPAQARGHQSGRHRGFPGHPQGSAECGIVYSTDAKSTDDVKVICEAPEDALDTPVIYPVAAVKDTNDTDATQAFMDFLQTKEAKDIFVEYGFTLHE